MSLMEAEEVPITVTTTLTTFEATTKMIEVAGGIGVELAQGR
jgi:hypothetical protein